MMTKKSNKRIILFISEDLEKAVFRSRKKPREIINTLSILHPEVYFNQKTWDDLNPSKRDVIIRRIRRTLEAIY
ncbi:MAG: hypothetical protein H6Q74_2451 [Firmicutes bacterium]|nr:hypothetical protein [Bacillota bacterium]